MRLIQSDAKAPAWSEIESATAAILSDHLEQSAEAPVAVAFSGGGDSLALLLIALAWARGARRRLVCLTVDHGLSLNSAAWTKACAERAHDLNLDHRALTWTGAKPSTGVAAAARSARHRLLADAAREEGASVILMGHTADDRLEARLMREEGCSVSEPRAWSPSPAWPEGRNVFILRPLLDVRRAAIRRGLREIGETWLDDPANADETSLRARVRLRIADGGDSDFAKPLGVNALLGAATVGWAGDIAAPLTALAAAAPATRHNFLGAALLCAAGTASPPRGEAVGRLWQRLSSGSPMTATLAGARIESEGTTVRIMRDDGAMGDSVWSSLEDPHVFDGRFEIAAVPGGGNLTAVAGHVARLDREERDTLRTAPPAARRALPGFLREDGAATCPAIRLGGRPSARLLVADRLNAALGAITCEATIGRVGETAPGVLDRAASIERSVHEPA